MAFRILFTEVSSPLCHITVKALFQRVFQRFLVVDFGCLIEYESYSKLLFCRVEIHVVLIKKKFTSLLFQVVISVDSTLCKITVGDFTNEAPFRIFLIIYNAFLKLQI